MNEGKVVSLFQSGKLAPSDKLVYLCLKEAAKGKTSNVTIRKISYSTGLAERTVKLSISRLRDLGLITIERQPDKRGKPNEYTLVEGE